MNRSRGAPPAASIEPVSAERSRASASARGTPEAANRASGVRIAASASGRTAASSCPNGSPRSTASRSATATNASRPALSAPAVAAMRSCALFALLSIAATRAVSASISL